MTMQGWYPVALSTMIAPGTSAGAVLLGQEIAVWRDSAGHAHAWEDRCPHRGMKLSFGFVRGDRIACLYHGWEYDSDGQCRRIPAHPTLAIPKTICVRTHGTAETGGMIWAAPGAAGAPPVLDQAAALRSLYIDAPPADVLDALPGAFGATEMNGAVPLVDLKTPDGALRIGVQPVDAARAALHITMAQDTATARRIAVSRAAARLRDRLDSGATR